MSGQRAPSAVAVARRSALPHLPGIPWWAAILVAGTAAAIGFAFDAGSGDHELSGFFAGCYVLGCLLAVLAVRQSGVFTAVIQPPLVLFVVVPGAYFLFHGSTVGGVKDVLINCGYPLIERFPLMFFTSAAVLVVGLIRWYLATLTGRSAVEEPDAAPSPKRTRSRLATEETTTLDAVDAAPGRRRRETSPRRERPTRANTSDDSARERPSRSRRTASTTTKTAGTTTNDKTAGGSRSRRDRPADPGAGEPSARPRRRPLVDATGDPPADPYRRNRSGLLREPLRDAPRDAPPVNGRSSREWPERRERPRTSERRDGYERSEGRRRPPVQSGWEPYDPFETRSTNGTHHPVSRVRYRGSDEDSEPEPRSRSRRARDSDLDSWEYDA